MFMIMIFPRALNFYRVVNFDQVVYLCWL